MVLAAGYLPGRVEVTLDPDILAAQLDGSRTGQTVSHLPTRRDAGEVSCRWPKRRHAR
jgi:hypothetical protein